MIVYGNFGMGPDPGVRHDPGMTPITSDPGKGPPPVTGTGPDAGGGYPSTINTRIDAVTTYDTPPRECTLLTIKLDASKVRAAQLDPTMDPASSFLQFLSAAQQAQVNNTISAYALKWSGLQATPQLHVSWTRGPQARAGDTSRDGVSLYVVKPRTAYDPSLYEYPVIPAGNLGNAFEAALRLFWPDWVISTDGQNPGTFLRNGKQGSLTPWGPFPYWNKTFVSQKMVDFAVKYLKTPGAFGAPGIDTSLGAGGAAIVGGFTGSKVGSAAGGVLGPLLASSAAAGSAAGPIGAAIGAAAGAIVGFFASIFGSGPPAQPDWLVRLLPMANLRKPGDFYAYFPQEDQTFRSSVSCPVAVIHNGPGNMTLLEGYEQVLRRLGGQSGSQFKWWPFLLGAAAIYAGS